MFLPPALDQLAHAPPAVPTWGGPDKDPSTREAFASPYVVRTNVASLSVGRPVRPGRRGRAGGRDDGGRFPSSPSGRIWLVPGPGRWHMQMRPTAGQARDLASLAHVPVD